jgi:hypothetical protein
MAETFEHVGSTLEIHLSATRAPARFLANLMTIEYASFWPNILGASKITRSLDDHNKKSLERSKDEGEIVAKANIRPNSPEK